jgi:hypothetical protein
MYNMGKKYLFSLDVETDSLYGDIFAIGVTVWDLNNPLYILDKFSAQSGANRVRDSWVFNNIVPVIPIDAEDFKTRKLMRDAFWEFYIQYKDNSIILADFAAPCEAYLFRKCLQDDKNRSPIWFPYPLHDLGTMLYMKDIDPDINRIEYANVFDPRLVKHNPVDDSITAAVIFFRLSGLLLLNSRVALQIDHIENQKLFKGDN